MRVAITGEGVLSPIGIGKQEFAKALKLGKTNFSSIQLEHLSKTNTFPGAFISGFEYKKAIDQLPLPEDLKNKARRLRNTSTGALHGVYVALEAWGNAELFDTDLDFGRIAIVASGSNVQQASLIKTQNRYREKLNFLNPTYAFNFLDTDLVGILSELLNVKGEGHSIGAASASGNMAVIQGHRLVANGDYDIVLVVAPTMELSIYEYQGFTALGAMASISEGKS